MHAALLLLQADVPSSHMKGCYPLKVRTVSE